MQLLIVLNRCAGIFHTTIISFLRHSPINRHLPEGDLLCIRMFGQFFALLPTLLFVRALSGKTVSTRTHEARADTLVEVSAPSVLSWARGGRSKFFSGGSGQDDFPGFSTRGLILYVRIGNMLSVFSSRLSWAVSTQLRQLPGIHTCDHGLHCIVS